MLEGQMVHLPAPKTHYARDIVFEKDTPIHEFTRFSFLHVCICHLLLCFDFARDKHNEKYNWRVAANNYMHFTGPR